MANMLKSRSGIIRFVRQCRFEYDSVTDPRREHGRVHALVGVLNLLVTSIACCKLPFRRVEALGQDLSSKGLRRLGLKSPPSDTTLQRVVAATAPGELHQDIAREIRCARRAGLIHNDLLPEGMVSFDGHGGGGGKGPAPNRDCRQTVHDAKGSPAWNIYTLRAFLVSSSAHPCVDQEIVHQDEGEPTRFPTLFERLVQSMGDLFRFVMSDAGITSRDNARLVRSKHKHFIFALKANFPVLYPRALQLLADAPVVAETVEREQGRTVHRILRRVGVPADFDFPSAVQLWMVEREVLHDNGTRGAYGRRVYITSIPWKLMSAKKILRTVRLHWAGAENGGNWTADVILDEDSYLPCRKGEASALLCWLRVLAYNLLSIFRAHQPKHDRRFMPWRRAAERLRDVCLRLSEVEPVLNL
jgi:hypothetical protein